MGHEFLGEVVEVGKGIKHFRRGDPVVVNVISVKSDLCAVVSRPALRMGREWAWASGCAG